MRDFKLQKLLIFAGLALLLVVDGALAYHNSQLSAKDQNPELALKAQSLQVALLKKDIERANNIKNHMPEVQKYFDQFESTLPPLGKGYSVISEEFDGVARETKVAVRDLKFRQKEVPGRNVDEIEIEAAVDGDYAGIVRFLNRLQRSKNTYVVDSLGLDSQINVGTGTQTPTGAAKVTLHLRSYFRKA